MHGQDAESASWKVVVVAAAAAVAAVAAAAAAAAMMALTGDGHIDDVNSYTTLVNDDASIRRCASSLRQARLPPRCPPQGVIGCRKALGSVVRVHSSHVTQRLNLYRRFPIGGFAICR